MLKPFIHDDLHLFIIIIFIVYIYICLYILVSVLSTI